MPPGYESEMEYYNTLDAGWYYDWWHGPVAGATNLDFVPMMWGDHVTTDALNEAVANSTAGELLGFNEPDITNQANMTVERAVKLWSSLENTGLRLGSPATGRRVLRDDSWFARFMAEAKAKDLRVDFIALHPYTTNPDVDALENYIIAVYEKYKLPIWITEFALVDFGDWNRFTYEDNAKFMAQAFQMLDDLIFVERYAWFSPAPNGDGLGIKTSFLDPEGNQTVVGKAYADLLSTSVSGKAWISSPVKNASCLRDGDLGWVVPLDDGGDGAQDVCGEMGCAEEQARQKARTRPEAGGSCGRRRRGWR